jgi:alpha-L-fucosidase 2
MSDMRRCLVVGASGFRIAMVLAAGLSPAACAPEQASQGLERSSDLILWYSQPAREWTEALPLGNGRLGAMVFGGVEEERIQFNEDTLWAGKPRDYSHPGAASVLPEIRRLLFDGKQKEAEDLAMDRFMSVPLRQVPYQPFGDLCLSFPGRRHESDYRRELDLDRAVSCVRYRIGEVEHRREVFVSAPDQALVMRITADRPAQVSFTARLRTPHPEARSRTAGVDRLALAGRQVRHVEPRTKTEIESVLRFEAQLRAIVEAGTCQVTPESIQVRNADAVTLLLVAATSFVNFRDVSADPHARCEAALRRLGRTGYAELRRRHVDDHQALFRRVSLDLDGPERASLPTDERIQRAAQRDDPSLAALFFQFGRYLLIASSRPGCQPANLQGVWNDQLSPPWDSKYTTNINLEMNYWPAEVTNLAECHEPLFDMLDDLAITGARTAQAHYNARGWVLHHNTDLWRGAAPINASNHGIWPTGGAWLCQHLWEHYQFSRDRAFLKKRAYPLMKAAALFFVDFLVEDPRTPESWLITTPSNSPEQGGLVAGPTMDHQIIRELFANTIRAAEILEVDQDLRRTLADKRRRIAPNRIGRYGQLQEWLEDKDDPKNEHRHVSHLWGLYPGSQITPRGTPDLAAAARQSLVFRGDGGTGWSKAWKIALWARLLDGDHAHKMLAEALAGNTYPNLFDAHPPFQIDGNFGGAAAIAEMLLQSHAGEIELLPALPKAWRSGSVRGLRARGGFVVDIDWRESQLTRATVSSPWGGACRVRYGERHLSAQIPRGRGAEILSSSFR